MLYLRRGSANLSSAKNTKEYPGHILILVSGPPKSSCFGKARRKKRQ